MTNTTITCPTVLRPTDESPCLLICCVLYDAIYLHYDAMDACPACAQMPGRNWCDQCWDTHCATQQRYRELCMNIQDFLTCDMHPEGTPYPLSQHDQETIAAALPEAITYREARSSIEGVALLAAYRELATRITR
jgi:hypothetical protein